MSAIIKACGIKTTIKNTAKICDVAMGATAMLIAVPKTFTFTEVDLEDPVEWLTNAIHAAEASRAYPFFGQQAPIRTITNAADNDVMVDLDDGSKMFLRYGFFNRTFETTAGGIGYAKVLQSLNRSGYSIIEIDKEGKMLVRQNLDGTFGGLLIDFMYSPSPILPDFKTTPYKNRFMLSYDPVEYVQNGVIFSGAEQLLSMMGLTNAEITNGGTASTTKLKVGVRTKSTKTDLVALFGVALGEEVDNFVVTNKATGVAVVPTAADIASGVVELAGTYTSGATYIINGAAPSVWLGNDVDGYDGSDGAVEIAIP
jgi:hypothetical protein